MHSDIFVLVGGSSLDPLVANEKPRLCQFRGFSHQDNQRFGQ